jgi:ligand-binding SRPBCC domain-containing protein
MPRPFVDPVAERGPRGLRVLRAVTFLPLPREEVFPFFAAAENLERITPPELRFRITSPLPIAMGPGTLIDYRLRLAGVSFGWRTEITEWDPPRAFTDTQLRGPYHTWVHSHRFEERDGGTRMVDEVRWRLPFWPLGEVAAPLVRRQLARIFQYRERAVKALMLNGLSDS